MGVDLQDRQNTPDADSNNPAEQHYNDTFNALTSAEHLSKHGKRGDDQESRLLAAKDAAAKAMVGGAESKLGATAISAGAGALGAGGAMQAASRLGQVGGFLFGSKKRKAATAGGGLSLLIAAVSIGSLFLSGPLELMHISQLLTGFHMQDQEDAADNRMSKFYRFMRGGGDFGETRLGYLASKYNKTMTADLDRMGLKQQFGAGKQFTGFTIDRKNERWKGMSDAEIQKNLEARGIKGITIEDRTVKISANGFFQQRKATKWLVKEMGYKGISSAMRARVLRAYGWVTWSPLKALDRKVLDKTSKQYKAYKEAREQRIKQGTGPGTVDQRNGYKETTNEDGETTRTPEGADTQPLMDEASGSSDGAKNVLGQLMDSNSVKAFNLAALAQAIACIFRAIAQEIGTIRYVQVVQPLMRIGMEAVTTGSQVEAGNLSNDTEDVTMNATSVAVASQVLHEYSEDGKLQSTWADAESIRAEEGKTGGVGPDEAIQGISKGVPKWLKWAEESYLEPVCSTAATVITGIVGFALGAITGPVSTIIGGIASYIIGPKVIDAAAGYLSGDAIKADAAGAQWGNYANYGTRLSANAMAMQTGGTALTDTEVAELSAERKAADAEEFSEQSLAYRVFNATDHRTLAAQVVDNSVAVQPRNIASTVGSLFTNLGSVVKLPSLFFTKAEAATGNYDYGFAKYGFSEADQNDPTVEDPYANAEEVEKILADPAKGPGYIDRAKKCFGLEIVQDGAGTGDWQVYPVKSVSEPDKFLNAYSGDKEVYDWEACRSESDKDWLRVRFYILDVGTFEGFACYKGDALSCDHDGVTSEDTDGSSGGSDFKLMSINILGSNHLGNAQQRAQKTTALIRSKDVDIFGVQEMQPDQFTIFDGLMTDFDSYPETFDEMTVGSAGKRTIYWNNTRYSMVGSGGTKVPWYQSPSLNDRGETFPWVKLQDTSTGQQFYVMNNHLVVNEREHADKKGLDPGGALKREKEAQLILEEAKKLNSDGTPVFLTGDFNSTGQLRNNDKAIAPDRNRLPYCILTSNDMLRNAKDMFESNGRGSCPSNDLGIDQIYATQEDVTVKNFQLVATGGVAESGTDHSHTALASISIAGQEGAGSPVKVASFNVLGASHTGGDGDARQRSNNQYIREQGFDIVGFQELQISQRKIVIDELGGDYAIYPDPGTDNKGHRTENSIIWKKSRFSKVAAGTNNNYYYFEGNPLHVPWVKLQDSSTGQMFIVQNTHDPADTKDHPNNTHWRELDAELHLADAKKWVDDGLPVFMTGDFNSGYVPRPDVDVLNGSVIPRDRLPYCIMTDGGTLRDSYDAWKGNSGKCPTTNLSGRIIDHVYVSADIKVNNSVVDTSQKNKRDTDHPVAFIEALIPGASPVGSTKMSNDYANECRAMQAKHPGLACDGECVDFVKFRLDKLTGKNFASLGNGGYVVNTLAGLGYKKDNSPAVNSVVSWPPGGVPGNGANDTYGHVAWVSQVNADGSIIVEEYNYLVSHGYDKRTIPKSIVPKLTYAHTEVDVR